MKNRDRVLFMTGAIVVCLLIIAGMQFYQLELRKNNLVLINSVKELKSNLYKTNLQLDRMLFETDLAKEHKKFDIYYEELRTEMDYIFNLPLYKKFMADESTSIESDTISLTNMFLMNDEKIEKIQKNVKILIDKFPAYLPGLLTSVVFYQDDLIQETKDSAVALSQNFSQMASTQLEITVKNIETLATAREAINQILTFIILFVSFIIIIFISSLAIILSIRLTLYLEQVEELNKTLEQKVLDRTEKLDNSLKEISIKDEKIHQELQMAGIVQKSLLPAIPSWDVKVRVRYNPLREVSGDFYDMMQTPDGGYILLIADVSGHGMPAALHAILAKKAFFKATQQESNLTEILQSVNKEMSLITTGHYLTSYMVKFDRKNTLYYANAGHPKAIWLSKKNKKIKLLDTKGSIVGIRDDSNALFQESSISFERGDRVFLYTDCLTERTNLEGEEFGENRLVNTLKKYFFNTLDDMIEQTMKDYYEFVEGTENKDDLTLLAMEFPEIS